MRQLSPPHRACENGLPLKRETFIDDPASHIHGRRRCISRGAIDLPRRRHAPLKFIPQSDLTILDPIVTTVYTARNHGMMVFDTLFGMDSAYQMQPQMLERLHRRGRRQALEAHPARRPAVARRRARSGARLRRLDPPLGGARRHRQPADGAHRRTGRARRPDDPVPPEEAIRASCPTRWARSPRRSAR